MAVMKTPGVYIVEKNAFPNSVVEVATAVPAFIGYTEKSINGNKSLLNKPWKISSMAEFRTYFGNAPTPVFSIADEKKAGNVIQINNKEYTLNREDAFTLYYNILLFYSNGGGPCYIISVGNYEKEVENADGITTKKPNQIEKKALEEGIQTLIKEQEPTIVVIPEATKLSNVDCYALQQAMLAHCGNEQIRSRIAILDVYNGYLDRKDPQGDVVNQFRESIGSNFLDFGVAYYPWLNTSIVQENELNFKNIQTVNSNSTTIEGWNYFQKKFYEELTITDENLIQFCKDNGIIDKDNATINEISEVETKLNTDLKTKKDAVENAADKKIAQEEVEKQEALNNKLFKSSLWLKRMEVDALWINSDDTTKHKILYRSSLFYAEVMKEIRLMLNLLPTSAAMAGIYTMVDNTKGVWKAPANVSVSSTISPSVNISHEEQEDLNVPINGKSVNAIRFFVGEGIKVWGARTLDGNSLDWRYINVRRTMIMLEQSVKNAAKAYIFDPNEANTWVNIKSMISNFLNGIWKRGGLAGTSPDDAYSVYVGLGETMTPEDILDGIMRVTVLVAITRPAEFIEITFQQQMQKS